MSNKTTRKPIEQRFWPKVQKTDGCWLWTGSRDHRGYGRIGSGGRNRPILAHRVSWELHYGSILENLVVCHRCDNPSCVRPDHLFLGNQQDNMKDCSIKRRTTFGMKSSSARLTDIQVIEIRQRYATGNISQYSLAKEYNVDHATVSAITCRTTWKHLP